MATDRDDDTNIQSEAKSRFSFRKTVKRMAGMILGDRSNSGPTRGDEFSEPTSSNPVAPISKRFSSADFVLPEIDIGVSLSELMRQAETRERSLQKPAYSTPLITPGLTQSFKPVGTDKPLPALPEKPLPDLPRYDRASQRSSSKSVEQNAEDVFNRILAAQQEAISKATAKVSELDRRDQKPPVDMRSLRSQKGDVFGSVAPRTPSPVRGGSSADVSEPPVGSGWAIPVKLGAIGGINIVHVTDKDTSSQKSFSAEFNSISRSASVSSVDSERSNNSVVSAISTLSNDTFGTPTSTNSAEQRRGQLPGSGEKMRTRPSMEELYLERPKDVTRG